MPRNATFDQIHWLRVLELAPGATRRQVQRAYRRLALRYHPDRVHIERDCLDASERRRRFDEVSQAYIALQKCFDADEATTWLDHCARCGDLEPLIGGLDGNGYCRGCLLSADGKRALPAPPTVIASCAFSTTGLIVSSASLALWVQTNAPMYWWASVGACLAAMVGLVVLCMVIRQTA